jgi:hypothetical protein
MKTSRLFNLSDKTTAHDRASGEEEMGSIERRKFLKAAALGGVALSIGGAASLLAPNGARAQGAPNILDRRRLRGRRNSNAATAKKRKTVPEVAR